MELQGMSDSGWLVIGNEGRGAPPTRCLGISPAC